jgi:hypothetical protein
MPSAKLSSLVSLAGAQVPTDLLYVADLSAGPAGSKSSTFNDAFSIITKNITDGALRFGGFAAPTPVAAQGSIYYDSATNKFKFSENNGAYRNLGDVSGPTSATDNAIARFDGATGKIIQDSVVTIADTTGNTAGMGTLNTHTIPAVAPDTFALLAAAQAFTSKTITASTNVLGGVTMTLGSDATGDIYYRSAGGVLTRLGIGSSTQVLTVSGGLPSWQPASGGGGTPGGANTQVQYNNSGAFGGITGFTSNGTNVTAGSGNLRANSPQISITIADVNGASIIGLSPVGSAVNQFTIANAAIGGIPVLSVTGSDINIPAIISPKGTGRLESTGPLRLSGTGTDTYTTPQGNSVPTKINVPNFDPGSFGQVVAMGLALTSGGGAENRRVLSLFDSRTVAHQPTIAVFSPDENNLIGFSWEGSNAIGFIKNTIGVVGLLDQVVQQSSGVNLVTLDTSANAYFGNGIVNAAPSSYVLQATGGSGSNIAGANLDLAGGKGTGTGTPGMVAIRFPLIGASSSTLQSLSTDRFPVSVCMYTITNGSTINNTNAETSIFTGNPTAATPSAGSTRTFQAGSARAGTFVRIRAHGTINETGTPALAFKLKLGATTIASTASFTISTPGCFTLEAELEIVSIGASGTVSGMLKFEGGADPGSITITQITVGVDTVDLTVDDAIDISAQWNAANVLNSLAFFAISIFRDR